MARRFGNRRGSRRGGSRGLARRVTREGQYNGPLHQSPRALDNIVREMRYTAVLNSGVGSALANVFGSTPSSSTDWTGMVGEYTEYRVLSMHLLVHPITKYYGGAFAKYPGWVVGDRANSTALTTNAIACNYLSGKFVDLAESFTYSIKASGPEETQWTTTASPSDKMWIKFFFSQLAVSSDYSAYMMSCMVEFRNGY